MNKFKVIQIDGNDSEILSVSLKDILDNIENGEEFNWSILWLQATGDLKNKPIIEFEKEIKKSEAGYIISWNDLNELSEGFFQVIEILLIGDSIISNIKRYSEDHHMYNSCDFTIELVDSSYWLIHSKKLKTLEKIKATLPGVKELF